MWSRSSSSTDDADSSEFFDALDLPDVLNCSDSPKALHDPKQSTLEHLKNLSLQEMYLMSLQQQLIRKRKDEQEEIHRKLELDKTMHDESECNCEQQKQAIAANEERRKKLSILRRNDGDLSVLEEKTPVSSSSITDKRVMFIKPEVSSDMSKDSNHYPNFVDIDKSEVFRKDVFKAVSNPCHIAGELKSCSEEQKFIILPLKHATSTCYDDSASVMNKSNPVTFIAFPSSTEDYLMQSSHSQHSKIYQDKCCEFEKSESTHVFEGKSEIVNPLSKQIRICAGCNQDNSFNSDDVSSLASDYSSNIGSATKSSLWFDRFSSRVESVFRRINHSYRHHDEPMSRRSRRLSQEHKKEKIYCSNVKHAEFFQQVKLLQTIEDAHAGAIWSMKFSLCGCLLATAGQDNLVKVWALKRYLDYFMKFRNTSLENNLQPGNANDSDACHKANCFVPVSNDNMPFLSKPFRVFAGHSSAVLDMSWSRSYFILTSSMDRTVRLWHVTRNESLCSFQHINFVTAIVFHPKDDRYFFSASLDGKLRLWNIPDKKVAQWHEFGVSDVQSKSLITAINILDEGNKVLVGTYDGRIFLFNECLKYNTMFFVGSIKRKRRKIIGIEPLNGDRDKILITTNDSRIRLYDLRLKEVICKYKGHCNSSSHIKAFISPDNQYVISGSENSWFYVWKRQTSGIRKHVNKIYQRVKASHAMVTVAIFSPAPCKIRQSIYPAYKGKNDKKQNLYHMIATADARGCIKLLWVF